MASLKIDDNKKMSSFTYTLIFGSIFLVIKSGSIDFGPSLVIDKIYKIADKYPRIKITNQDTPVKTSQLTKNVVSKPDHSQSSKTDYLRPSLDDALAEFNAITYHEPHSKPNNCLNNLKSCSPGPFIESLNINVDNKDIDLYDETSQTDLDRTTVSEDPNQEFTISMFTKLGKPRPYGGDFITTD